MQKTPLYLITLLITLVAILNLGRFIFDIPITVDGIAVLAPWTGAVAFVVLGLLASWAFKSLWSSDSSHH